MQKSIVNCTISHHQMLILYRDIFVHISIYAPRDTYIHISVYIYMIRCFCTWRYWKILGWPRSPQKICLIICPNFVKLDRLITTLSYTHTNVCVCVWIQYYLESKTSNKKIGIYFLFSTFSLLNLIVCHSLNFFHMSVIKCVK